MINKSQASKLNGTITELRLAEKALWMQYQGRKDMSMKQRDDDMDYPELRKKVVAAEAKLKDLIGSMTD